MSKTFITGFLAAALAAGLVSSASAQTGPYPGDQVDQHLAPSADWRDHNAPNTDQRGGPYADGRDHQDRGWRDHRDGGWRDHRDGWRRHHRQQVCRWRYHHRVCYWR